MSEWRIYYGDGSVVTGTTEPEWTAAPAEDVQVVVLMEPYPHNFRPWRGVSDRQIWTGDDTYDPFGWGVKHGKLISRRRYDAIWKRAFGDN